MRALRQPGVLLVQPCPILAEGGRMQDLHLINGARRTALGMEMSGLRDAGPLWAARRVLEKRGE